MYKRQLLASALHDAGVQVAGGFFDTLHVTDVDAMALHAKAAEARINLRAIDAGSVGISLDETSTREDLVALAKLFDITLGDIDALDAKATDALPAALVRTSAFLTHPVFNTHHSEHEMLRYICLLYTSRCV